jgi:hypothetical protein
VTPLQVAAIIVSMFLSASGIVFVAGKLVQRLSSHEELDKSRFDTQEKMWEEVRDDIREIRNVMGRKVHSS